MSRIQAILFTVDNKFTEITFKVNKNETVASTLARVLGFEVEQQTGSPLGNFYFNPEAKVQNNLAVHVQSLNRESPWDPTMSVHGNCIFVGKDDKPAMDKDTVKLVLQACKAYIGENKKSKKAAGPKRGKKPYDFFCKEYHSEHTKPVDFDKDQVGQSWFNYINNESRSAWAALPEESKQKYLTLASEDKIRYDTELAAFLVENPLPPKKSSSAYNLYCKEKKISVNQQGKADNNITPWKDVTEEERQPYVEAAAKDVIRYKQELEAFKLHCETHNKNFDHLMSQNVSKKRMRKQTSENEESVKVAKTEVAM